MGKLILLAVLAGGGWFAYRHFTGGADYGRSTDAPLGTFEKIDRHLIDAKFVRSETSVEEMDGNLVQRIPGAKVYLYQHVRKDLEWTDSVAVCLDERGQVRGVGARFFTGRREFSPGGPPAESFASDFWMQVAGAKPDLKTRMRGQGRLAEEYLEARWAGQGLKGEWLKRGMSGRLDGSVNDSVTFYTKE